MRGGLGPRAKPIVWLAAAVLGILLLVAGGLVGRGPAPQPVFGLARCAHHPGDIAVWLTNRSKVLVTFPAPPRVECVGKDGTAMSISGLAETAVAGSKDLDRLPAGRVGQFFLVKVPAERFRIQFTYCYDASPVPKGLSWLIRKLPQGWQPTWLTKSGFTWAYRCGLGDGKCWRVFRSPWVNRQDLPVWSDPPRWSDPAPKSSAQ